VDDCAGWGLNEEISKDGGYSKEVVGPKEGDTIQLPSENCPQKKIVEKDSKKPRTKKTDPRMSLRGRGFEKRNRKKSEKYNENSVKE